MGILEACYYGDLNQVYICIQNGEPLNKKDGEYHRTPLQWSIVCGHFDVAKYLLDLNIADFSRYDLLIDHTDIQGKSAKTYAIERKLQNNDPRFLATLDNWKRRLYYPEFEATSLVKSNCAWAYMRTKMTKVGSHTIKTDEGKILERYPLVSETLHAKLTHHSRKTGELKWSLPLDTIHHKLRTDLKTLDNSDGNVLVADVTVEFKIEGSTAYESITIPIRITPRFLFGKTQAVFTMTQAEEMVCAQTGAPYLPAHVLQPIYDNGKSAIHFCGTHGSEPEYFSSNPSHQQFNRHSEQALVAYLSFPETSQSLVNRLKIILHERGLPQNANVKVYMIALHIHSEQTTCGACERVLVGLQNSRTSDVSRRGSGWSFVEQMEAALLQPNDVCTFRLPTSVRDGKIPGLRCYVTISADRNDHPTHQKSYITHRRVYDSQPTNIETSNSATANRLFVARFQENSYCKGVYNSKTASRTFFSSASAGNKKTPEKEAKYARCSQGEMDDLADVFRNMFS